MMENCHTTLTVLVWHKTWQNKKREKKKRQSMQAWQKIWLNHCFMFGLNMQLGCKHFYIFHIINVYFDNFKLFNLCYGFFTLAIKIWDGYKSLLCPCEVMIGSLALFYRLLISFKFSGLIPSVIFSTYITDSEKRLLPNWNFL
jgi:hypothetical protein